MKNTLTCFIMVGLAVVTLAYYAHRPAAQPVAPVPVASGRDPIAQTTARPTSKPQAGLPTAKVERGNLICTVPAKGTVKLEEVEVGAQMTGMIASFGSDPADPSKPLDCGSHVRQGMVLAQIDPTIYKAQVDYAEAALWRPRATWCSCRPTATRPNMSGSGPRACVRRRPSPTPITTWP